MDIKISNCLTGHSTFEKEGQTDEKTLPCITIVNCIRGKYEVYINRERYEINAGECFYTQEDARQTIIHHMPEDGEDRRMSAQWVYMTVLINDKFNLKKYFSIPNKLTSKRLSNYVTEYCKTVQMTNIESLIQRKYLEYAILNELIKNGETINFRHSERLEKAISVIVSKLYEDISLSELAGIVNYSESYLYHLFKNELGVTPHQYIMKQKLKRACELLVESDMPVSCISDTLGFYDQFHFCRRFKAEYRITPTEYRKNYSFF